MSKSLNDFCECLIDCLDRRINDLAGGHHSSLNEQDVIGEYMKDLSLKVEKIMVGSITLFLKFGTSAEKISFILSVTNGNFLQKIQKFVLSGKFCGDCAALNQYAKVPNSTEYLSSDERKMTEDFLQTVFKGLRILIWMPPTDLADPFAESTLPSEYKLRVRITAPSYPKAQLKPAWAFSLRDMMTSLGGVPREPSTEVHEQPALPGICRTLYKHEFIQIDRERDAFSDHSVSDSEELKFPATTYSIPFGRISSFQPSLI